MVKPTVADLVRALRERLDLTQEQVAERSGAARPEKLDRTEVAHVEGGHNKATSDRFRTSLARGLGIPRETLVDLLDGRITVEQAAAAVGGAPRGNGVALVSARAEHDRMSFDPVELEGIARLTYELAGADPGDPPPIFDLALAVLGARVDRPAWMVGTPGRAYTAAGQDRIAVRASVPIEHAQFFCAHELAHIVLRRLGHPEAADEEHADYLGAALVMPRGAVEACFRTYGFSPLEIAETFVVTQTAAALRVGEVLALPVAAITPALVRVRGPHGWVWPDEATIRRWAVRPGPGLARVRLTDQPRRVALVANDD